MKRFTLLFAFLLILAGTIALPAPGTLNCGGVDDPGCPTGTTCYDVPGDGCSPACGTDCAGVCASVPTLFCGGIAQFDCPVGMTCVDDPADKCRPDCGGADCSGICVESEGISCGGITGGQCPAGYTCEDSTGDGCHPACGGADCGGSCVRAASAFCGGIAGFLCPGELLCVDDPTDSCDVECNGADCGGICVEPVPGCDGAVPSSAIDLFWPEPTHMSWVPLDCADWYNAYRLTAQALVDADGDGMADDYGECLESGIEIPIATDLSEPPQGFTNFYLVSGGNVSGEGPLGPNGEPQGRPTRSPCP